MYDRPCCVAILLTEWFPPNQHSPSQLNAHHKKNYQDCAVECGDGVCESEWLLGKLK